MQLNLPSPLQELHHPSFEEKDIKVWIKRDDLIHEEISGNKWRKLSLNIEKFQQGKFEKIITFGGPYANHIAATAAACRELSIPSIGYIRGQELSYKSNDTLKKAHQDGMELIFISRSAYAQRNEKEFQLKIQEKHENNLLIPEGGSNFHGVMGCVEIVKELPVEPNYLITACGTGTTAAGLLMGTSDTIVVGVPVLKGGDFIRENVIELLQYSGFIEEDIQEAMQRFQLETGYHFGGYGKWTEDLTKMIRQVESEFSMYLDQVYTGKMFYAFKDMMDKNMFPTGSNIVLLHTGGLQGRSKDL